MCSGKSQPEAAAAEVVAEEETDCWAADNEEEESDTDTIIPDDEEEIVEVGRKKRKTVEGAIMMDASAIEALFSRLDQRMEARMGPSQEMRDFYKTQTESMKKATEPPAKMKEDKMELVDRDVRIKDDGKTTIDVAARVLLGKSPNSAPELWWSSEIPQITKPRLAHSLQYGHITGSFVCRETVWKFHDRGEFLTLKHFSSNNSGVTCKVQKKVSIDDGATGEFVGTSDKDWKEITGLSEAKEAVRNIQVLTMMIRNYDYGPMTWASVLDKVFWFSGPSRGDKGIQKDLVVTYADTMLRLNATRGLNEMRPLIYKEALEQAKLTCHALHCDDSMLLVEHVGGAKGRGGGANLNVGGGGNLGNLGGAGRGGQTGGRRGGGRGGGNNLNNLGGGANLNNGGGARPNLNNGGEARQSAYGSVEDNFRAKELQTCVHWNMRRCKREQTCNKLHQCSYNMGNGKICWDKVRYIIKWLTKSNNDDYVTGTHKEDAPGECQRSRTAKTRAVNRLMEMEINGTCCNGNGHGIKYHNFYEIKNKIDNI